jgi:Protein of unknown function (DUF1446).
VSEKSSQLNPIRIANFSGFYGDRFSAPVEVLQGGRVDFLTGDYLAELTMFILWKQRNGGRGKGYAATFLKQAEHIIGTCVDQNTRIITNAGGLNPAALADDLRTLAEKLGISCRVAHIEGDDILAELPDLEAQGVTFQNLDTGELLSESLQRPVTANVYLGAWGIVECLDMDADIVIGPRITDASLVVGPCAWAFDWTRDDWNKLASAVAVGHIIECGPQATGGNYAFHQELPNHKVPGYPIAEVSSDGSAIITKHSGTGGMVTVGTVTAQLLYEVGGSSYLNPDVTTWLDTVSLEQVGPDRVRVSDVQGTPPPPDLKACLNLPGGYRNSVGFMITGGDVPEKAAIIKDQLSSMIDPLDSYDDVDIRLIDHASTEADRNHDAVSKLVVTVKSSDPSKVGRRFANVATSLSLSSYPGFFTETPPKPAEAFGVYWPALIPPSSIQEYAVGPGGERRIIEQVPTREQARRPQNRFAMEADRPFTNGEVATELAPLGTVAGARSGDKGAAANVGFWTRYDDEYDWLSAWLTSDRLVELAPELGAQRIERYALPNLRAINFVIPGLLAPGVAATARPDPHAKGLGEFFRSRIVPVPISFVARARRQYPRFDSKIDAADSCWSPTTL